MARLGEDEVERRVVDQELRRKSGRGGRLLGKECEGLTLHLPLHELQALVEVGHQNVVLQRRDAAHQEAAHEEARCGERACRGKG